MPISLSRSLHSKTRNHSNTSAEPDCRKSVPTNTASEPKESDRQWSVDVGVDVVGACGHKIGEVVDVRDDCVVVEKGFFMPEDIFVPKSAISDTDEHHLRLNVTKDSVDHSNWAEDPDETTTDEPERRVG